MRIFEVDFDRLGNSDFRLLPEAELKYFGKYPEEFFGQVLLELQKITYPAPDGYEIAAMIYPDQTEQDGLWYIGGTRNVGWELRAGTPVFRTNLIQIWICNYMRKPLWHYSDLFLQPAYECFEANNPAGIKQLITKRMLLRVTWLDEEKRKKEGGLLGELQQTRDEIQFFSTQLKLLQNPN